MLSQTLDPGTVIDKFQVVRLLGKGGYGDVYLVNELRTNRQFAMKTEFLTAQNKGLNQELQVLLRLGPSHFFPGIVAHGQTPTFKWIVTELLGPSLSACRRLLDGNCYLLFTVLKLALEMVRCIERLHKRGFVHRDVKPANFLLKPNRSHPVSLIDFGLAKDFLENGAHVACRANAGFTGTCRYASAHAHEGMELGRRDDLMSWFYSVVELVNGELPWPGSKDREATVRAKQQVDAEVLCKRLPEEFVEIYKYISGLGFDENPDYMRIKRLIRQAAQKKEFENMIFDWEYLHSDEVKMISAISLEMTDAPESSDSLNVREADKGGCAPMCCVA